MILYALMQGSVGGILMVWPVALPFDDALTCRLARAAIVYEWTEVKPADVDWHTAPICIGARP